jgi:hypothetical protein
MRPDRHAGALQVGTPVVIHIVKYNRPAVTYPGTVAADDGTQLVVEATWVMDVDLGFVRFEPGDRSTEHYWRSHWYGICEVRKPDGALKGWYCNISRPLVIDGRDIYSDDLELDLWISHDRRSMFRLDEDEFIDRGVADRDPPAAVAARRALVDLETLDAVAFAELLSFRRSARRPTA